MKALTKGQTAMVKRVILRRGVEWIAENDNAGDENALIPRAVAEYLSVIMLADVLGKSPRFVATCVVRYRREHA